jgi:hypothetical protein
LPDHEPHCWYNDKGMDQYHLVQEQEDWAECPKCGLAPKVWLFDNGRSTICGCWTDTYNRHRVFAESIMSIYKRTGCTAEWSSVALRDNWNHWCATGEHLFVRAYNEKGVW